MRRIALSLAFGLWTTTSALAQSVLVVDDDGGPGVDHTTIQAAVDAAAPGAIVLIRDGLYTSATIDGKSLVLTAEVTGAVVVEDGLTVTNLGPGDVVTLREVGLAGSEPVRLDQNQGVVWLESVLLVGDLADTDAGLVVVNSARVVVRHSAIVGGARAVGYGIRAEDSTLYVYDTTVRGGDGGEYVAPGAGALLTDSFLYASNSSFEGGYGGESTCFHPTNGIGGGDGIILFGSGATQVFASNTTFIGGAGGPEPCGLGSFGPDGLPVNILAGTFQEITETVRGLSVSTPVRTDEQATVEVTGGPGEFAFLLFGPAPAPLFLPALFDALLLPLPANSLFVGALDGAGDASLQVTPALPPGSLGRTLYVQAFFIDLGAPPSGQLSLAAPSSVVILDPAL